MRRTVATPVRVDDQIMTMELVGTRAVGADEGRFVDHLVSTLDTPASAGKMAATTWLWPTIVIGRNFNFWEVLLEVNTRPALCLGTPNHHQHQKIFRRG
jgi:hypothetical protein